VTRVQQPRKRGFTLLELAVVLVLVGLMAAIIVEGSSLLDTARETVVRKRFQNIVAAVNIYRNDHDRRPRTDTETHFWTDLAATGALSGITHERGPTNPVQPGKGYDARTPGARRFRFATASRAASPPFPHNAVFVTVPERVAAAADREMDDGNADTGRVRGVAPGGTCDYTTAPDGTLRDVTPGVACELHQALGL